MIGMSFLEFIILLVIAIIVAAIYHYGVKYYVTPGIGSFISKIIIGWIGAWLGTPVFGHWFDGLVFENVYFIPAILGSLAFTLIMVDLVKTFKAGPSSG